MSTFAPTGEYASSLYAETSTGYIIDLHSPSTEYMSSPCLVLSNWSSSISLSIQRHRQSQFARSSFPTATTPCEMRAMVMILPRLRTWQLWSRLRARGSANIASLYTCPSGYQRTFDDAVDAVYSNFRSAGSKGRSEPFKDAGKEGWHIYWKGDCGSHHPIQLDLVPMNPT
jgi:hypothetical protein